MDPQVSEDRVPAYDIIEATIKQLDNTVIIFRIFYILDRFVYKLQLLKKDTMCVVEIPKKLLLAAKNGDHESERQLTLTLTSSIESTECWHKVET